MRKLTWLLGAAFIAAASVANALELKEGKHYTSYNPPQATEARDRVEVTEFFWFGCGHCFNLEPHLNKWLKKLPKDVSFRRIPAVFPGRDGGPGNWAPAARLFYSLEAMGIEEKLHNEIFDAIHIERQTRIIFDDKVMLDFLAKKGVDTKKFSDIYNSFAIQGKVRGAMQASQAHGLDSVPALIVDGRYKPIAAGESGSADDIFMIVDGLIDKARKDRGKK